MPELREYVRPTGVSEFGRWFEALDALAAARVSIALVRLGEGNTSNVKGIGEGVAELRVHFGPGYRVDLAADGPELWVLLRGGTKRNQSSDIRKARRDWRSYRADEKPASK